MSDERLRELERTWRRSGDPADEALWLRERVRLGDPAPERITFVGNPWPAGHRVVSLEWRGRLRPGSGLWFELDLETADYDEDDGPDADEDEADEDWVAKGCWQNYHACSITANEGFLVATPVAKLDLDALAGREFHVDPVAEGADAGDLDRDDLAFHVYLLGHDTVADHRLRFALRDDPSTFWLSWRGRIALTYAGREDFAHRFELPLRRVTFGGITFPTDLSEPEAFALLGRHVVALERFRLTDREDGPRFMPT